MLVLGFYPFPHLFLGTALVLVISPVDLLVGYLLTFACFRFFLGSWYNLLDEYSPLEVGCSTPL